ncbi:MAG: YigZ family protein [Flavobacteriales bacterium]|nr:MAG: YigZ family protein [Flavobacteriales bacterium]
MAEDAFKISISEGCGEYREKGSSFLGFAFPLDDEKILLEKITELKKQHPKGRHFCYAYRITEHNWRASDDGEPKHSAGTPILHQIQSAELYQTAVVVVRYFGGTKLGVPGLINAYKQAASEALENTKSQEIWPTIPIHLTLSYEQYHHVLQLLTHYDYTDLENQHTEIVEMHLSIRESQLENFEKQCVDMQIEMRRD